MKVAVLALLMLVAAALSFGQSAHEPAPDTLIVLQRGACEQRCAVYRLTIFADGTVIYEGRYFVHRSGLIKSGISPDVLNKLIGDLESRRVLPARGAITGLAAVKTIATRLTEAAQQQS